MKNVFEIFVSDDSNPQLQKPFLVDDFTVACDSHALIWKNGVENIEIGTPSESVVRATKGYILSFPLLTKMLSVQDFEKAIEYAPKKEGFNLSGEDVICKDCQGEGSVEFSYYSSVKRQDFYEEKDCPVCDGSGYTSQKREIPNGEFFTDLDSELEILANPYRMKMVHQLISLMKETNQNQIQLSESGEKRFYWKCGEYRGLCMGLYNSENIIYKIN